MKRLLTIAGCFSFVLLLAGCSGQGSPTAGADYEQSFSAGGSNNSSPPAAKIEPSPSPTP
jgi:hypothetical protein